MNWYHIVTAAQLGDGQAFGQIVHRFQDMAFACAYAMLGDPGLAQDAAQEAFSDSSHSHSLAPSRGPVSSVGEYVSLHETIRGCQAILNGDYDDVAEEALYFIGKIEAADIGAARVSFSAPFGSYYCEGLHNWIVRRLDGMVIRYPDHIGEII